MALSIKWIEKEFKMQQINLRQKLKQNEWFYTAYKCVRKILNTLFPSYKVDWSNKKSYKKNIEVAFKNCFGYKLNLRNPKTFSEKMQWLRLYDNTPLKTELSDKYLVKFWVKDKIGEEYIIPTLGVWDSADDILFDTLPAKFVLKCNHGCGYNIIVHDKTKLDINETKRKLTEWMKEDFSTLFGEIHYEKIQRKIIAEQYIENLKDEVFDYKYYCFNGKPYYIMFCFDRSLGIVKNTFYDLKWVNQKVSYFGETYTKSDIKKPEFFDLMTTLAEKLCSDFKHVRVDFYNINGKIYFGEMTFTAYGGYFQFQLREWDLKLGNLLRLN